MHIELTLSDAEFGASRSASTSVRVRHVDDMALTLSSGGTELMYFEEQENVRLFEQSPVSVTELDCPSLVSSAAVQVFHPDAPSLRLNVTVPENTTGTIEVSFNQNQSAAWIDILGIAPASDYEEASAVVFFLLFC